MQTSRQLLVLCRRLRSSSNKFRRTVRCNEAFASAELPGLGNTAYGCAGKHCGTVQSNVGGSLRRIFAFPERTKSCAAIWRQLRFGYLHYGFGTRWSSDALHVRAYGRFIPDMVATGRKRCDLPPHIVAYDQKSRAPSKTGRRLCNRTAVD